jgi:hypothetical protein
MGCLHANVADSSPFSPSRPVRCTGIKGMQPACCILSSQGTEDEGVQCVMGCHAIPLGR